MKKPTEMLLSISGGGAELINLFYDRHIEMILERKDQALAYLKDIA